MSTLLDSNGRPSAKPASNGESQTPRDVLDVRTVPTGTLIFNLIKFTMEETGLDNMRQQMLMMKEQQKMVADPPQLGRLTEHLQMVAEHRYVIASEINARFKDFDEAYRARLGIEIFVPTSEKESTTLGDLTTKID